MNGMVWKPNVTVAAIIERKGRFLLVEEETDEGIRFNQPAGHLEHGESLVDAVIRETFEETACRLTPQALIGIYRWAHPVKDLTYLRFAFCGTVGEADLDRKLDTGIIAARWLTLDEVHDCRDRHRSPLVLRCIEDYLAGRQSNGRHIGHHYPLDLIVDFKLT